MKKIFASLFLFSACALGAACGSSGELPSSAQTASSAPDSPLPVTLTALQNNGGVNWGASTQDGFYYVNTTMRKDGSCNLMYADYKSEQIVYLCSQTNCAHDSASCTSYLMPTLGGIMPERVGDKIILFYINSSWSDEGEEPARVESINFDGSGRQTIHTFRPEETPRTTMVTDGQNIYFVLETVQEDTSVQKNLAKLDTLTGDLELLQEMSVENAEYIWGCCGEDLIVYQCEMQNDGCIYQLSRWDFISDSKEPIYTWNNSSDFPILYENFLGLKGSDGYYHLLNLESGSDFTFTQYLISDSYLPSIMFADDSGIIIRELIPTSKYTADSRYISIKADGSAEEWSLLSDEDGDKHPFIPIFDLNDKEYLVYVGYADESDRVIEDDGTSKFIEVPRRLYSIMSKSDFWNGKNIQHPLQYNID